MKCTKNKKGLLTCIELPSAVEMKELTEEITRKNATELKMFNQLYAQIKLESISELIINSAEKGGNAITYFFPDNVDIEEIGDLVELMDMDADDFNIAKYPVDSAVNMIIQKLRSKGYSAELSLVPYKMLVINW